MIGSTAAIQAHGPLGFSESEHCPRQEVTRDVIQGSPEQRIENGRMRGNALGWPAVVVEGMRLRWTHLFIPVFRAAGAPKLLECFRYLTRLSLIGWITS